MRRPPALPVSKRARTARFLGRPLAYLFGAQRRLGERFAFEVMHRDEAIILISRRAVQSAGCATRPAGR